MAGPGILATALLALSRWRHRRALAAVEQTPFVAVTVAAQSSPNPGRPFNLKVVEKALYLHTKKLLFVTYVQLYSRRPKELCVRAP